jgi:hypothetical protein
LNFKSYDKVERRKRGWIAIASNKIVQNFDIRQQKNLEILALRAQRKLREERGGGVDHYH